MADTSRFCSRCGQPVLVESDETVLGDLDPAVDTGETLAPDSAPAPARTPLRPVSPIRSSSAARTPRPVSSSVAASSSDPIGGGRFASGSMVGDRYRIVALLGHGGMGEVYRAEDLKLSQVVAIKFLPPAFSEDPATLARFHSEVRVARQVSHPNVCRVFDIGDADGVPFLTMEYVDGEDLSSLVRRIGRLPQDKAVEVSRQICAGLAAAHERGVIHRDLKPANLMLDGAGKVRITDFGLAGIAENIRGADVRAGTPAYMAPEQLAGKEVTLRSDIYSLGLVMYEISTGKRAFDAVTLPELLKVRQEGEITKPSTLVRDLDPLIERVILRCLDTNPASRPASALQVAAALPGGDPLAAALAAGETPSPEMVAAAGEKEATNPKLAIACLLGVLLLIVLCTYLGARESGLKIISPQNSTEVMVSKARDIVASLGYPEKPADSYSGFFFDTGYLNYLGEKDRPRATWDHLLKERPSGLQFWYRQSPKELVADGFHNLLLTPGVVTETDPQQIFSGMVNVELDHTGRLMYFQAIPPEKENGPPPTKEVNWQPLFAAAGLDPSTLRNSQPVWNSLASSDTRVAWDGVWPGTDRPLHVEAAALHGLPVYFLAAGPWTQPSRMPGPKANASPTLGSLLQFVFLVGLAAGTIWLAFRNLRRGKGDRAGATRLAIAAFPLAMVVFLAAAHLRFSGSTIGLVILAMSTGLFFSGVLWVLYLALEPWVRRNWPQTIISWSRVLAGKIRDPLVGRDVLFGVLLGLVWVFVYFSGVGIDMRRGGQPNFAATNFLDGGRASLYFWLSNIAIGIFAALTFFLVLVFFRVVLRNRWLAAALFIAVFATPKILSSEHRLVDSIVWISIYAISAFAIVHFGLVVMAVASFTANVLLNLPYTLDLSEWYSPYTACTMLSFIVLAAWGFYESLAGQKLWKGELFE
jgi:serine/threonine-protein kinase